MSRTLLTDRRPNVTVKVRHTWANGNANNLIVTFGFVDRDHIDVGGIRELFTADFKEGTDMHALIGDACVVLSLLLQHGYSIPDIIGKLAPAPRSIIATLLHAAMEIGND